MSKTTLTRRGVLKSGAVAGAGVALPTIFTASSAAAYELNQQVLLSHLALTFHKLVHTQTKVLTNFARTCLLLST